MYSESTGWNFENKKGYGNMKKNYTKMAQEIIEYSGGLENFVQVTNCATRVRATYLDKSKVDLEKIKSISGVLSIIEDEGYQIVVGPGVCNIVASEINKKLNGMEMEEENKEILANSNKKTKNIFRILSDIFVPVLPAMIAGGVLQGLNNCLINFAKAKALALGLEGTEELSAAQVWLQQHHLLSMNQLVSIIFAAAFGSLAIYVGYNSAKQFKLEPVLGAMLGAITLQGTLTNIGAKSGQGGLLGVVLGVFVMAYIQKMVKKFVPNIIDVIVTPVLVTLITAVLMVTVLMPICGMLSDSIVNGLLWLLDTTGPIGGFVLSALAPLLISTGLHHGLTTIHMEMINATGVAPLFACQIMSNAGMVGAACAIFVLTKQKSVKEVCKGAIPTSFLCVGEPVIYGVCLPAGFAFITGSIGAGVGGFFIRLFDVGCSAVGMAGMSAIPLVADGKYVYYIISYFVAAIAAFVLTVIVGKAKHYQ